MTTSPAAAEMVDCLELGDLVQPRAEPGIAAERADLLGDDDQRVLGDVLDRLRVEHQLADGAANDPEIVDGGEKQFEGDRRPLGGGSSDLIEQRSRDRRCALIAASTSSPARRLPSSAAVSVAAVTVAWSSLAGRRVGLTIGT